MPDDNINDHDLLTTGEIQEILSTPEPREVYITLIEYATSPTLTADLEKKKIQKSQRELEDNFNMLLDCHEDYQSKMNFMNE